MSEKIVALDNENAGELSGGASANANDYDLRVSIDAQGHPCLVTSRGLVPWCYTSYFSPNQPTSARQYLGYGIPDGDRDLSCIWNGPLAEGNTSLSEAVFNDGSLDIGRSIGITPYSDRWGGDPLSEPLGEVGFRNYAKEVYTKLLDVIQTCKQQALPPKDVSLIITRGGGTPRDTTLYGKFLIQSDAYTTTNNLKFVKNAHPLATITERRKGFAFYMPMSKEAKKLKLTAKINVKHIRYADSSPSLTEAVNNAWRFQAVFDIYSVNSDFTNMYSKEMSMRIGKILKSDALSFNGAEVKDKEVKVLFDNELKDGSYCPSRLYVVIPRFEWEPPPAETYVGKCLYQRDTHMGEGTEDLRLSGGCSEVECFVEITADYVGP